MFRKFYLQFQEVQVFKNVVYSEVIRDLNIQGDGYKIPLNKETNNKLVNILNRKILPIENGFTVLETCMGIIAESSTYKGSELVTCNFCIDVLNVVMNEL